MYEQSGYLVSFAKPPTLADIRSPKKHINPNQVLSHPFHCEYNGIQRSQYYADVIYAWPPQEKDKAVAKVEQPAKVEEEKKLLSEDDKKALMDVGKAEESKKEVGKLFKINLFVLHPILLTDFILGGLTNPRQEEDERG